MNNWKIQPHLKEKLEKISCQYQGIWGECARIILSLANSSNLEQIINFWDYPNFYRFLQGEEKMLTLEEQKEFEEQLVIFREENQELIQQVEKEKSPEILKIIQHDYEQVKTELYQLSDLLFPNFPYNFTELKQELARLKTEELISQLQTKKTHLANLVSNAKEQLSSDLKPILALYLQTLKQADNELIRGQLQAYETILQNKLTAETIERINQLQIEIIQSEQHLTNLQANQNTEQLAQVVQLFPQ